MTNKEQPVTSDNIHRYLTIGIKTFHRPECLEYCVHSIRERYKRIVTFIADDSTHAMKIKNREVLRKVDNVTILDLPFNSGLSFGRNRMVERTSTPYYLTLDDDNYIQDTTDIVGMTGFLKEKIHYGLIAGTCPNRGILYDEMSASYSMCFEEISSTSSKRIIKTRPNSERIPNSYLDNTFKTNLTLNLFVARTELLKYFPWNEARKLGEHEDFFLRLFKENINCAISHDVAFGELLDDRRIYDFSFPEKNIHDLYVKDFEFQ